MRFHKTPIVGAFVVEIEPHADERGFFARTWCAHEFAEAGLASVVAQASMSRNAHKGTIRGMHLQLPPSREAKLVRCTRGAIHDVIVDLRPASPTYMSHFAAQLTAGACDALYIPPLVAHGFQTLADDTDVLYQMSDVYAPELGCGFRWDDPAFGIDWPIRAPLTIIARDRTYPDFDPESHAARVRAGTAISLHEND